MAIISFNKVGVTERRFADEKTCSCKIDLDYQ